MSTLYDAYQAYERQVIRGEFDSTAKRIDRLPVRHEPLLEQLADLLIASGMRLKRRYAAGKTMAWSPLSGSRP